MISRANQIIAIAIYLLITGCAAANVSTRPGPLMEYIPDLSAKTTLPKHVNANAINPSPRVCYLDMVANGNGYATEDFLITRLLEEGAKNGAELVVTGPLQYRNGGTVGTYGGGVMMAQSMAFPYMGGAACKFAKATIGIAYDTNFVITYVSKGSAAEKASLVEGYKIVAINGKPLLSQALIPREFGLASPGDKIEVEYLDKNNDKGTTVVTMEALSPTPD